MSNNIKLIQFSIFISLLLVSIQGYSQMESELQDFDVETSRPENAYKWQFSADLTSITAMLLGGNTYGSGHVGIGGKYRFGSHALRFQSEYYGNSNRNGWPPVSRVVDVVNDELIYLMIYEQGTMVRSGFGLEKGWEKERRRFYLLADLLGNYEQIQISASNRNTTAQDLNGGWQDTYNHSNATVNAFGLGITPGVGYEFYAWKHIGFTLEAKLDFTTTFSQGVFIDDSANILRNGRTIYFRTFPLLDFRIHYRI